jgi:hypothetical protein
VGLTWRDLASGLAAALLVVVFAAFESGSDFPLVSSAWAASATALCLAIGCSVAAAIDLHTQPQPRAGVIIRRATTVAGTIAVLAGLGGLIGNSARALELLVMATLLLWLAATCWHIYGIGADQ